MLTFLSLFFCLVRAERGGCLKKKMLNLNFYGEEKRISVCAQSFLTLRHPMNCDPPGSSIHGISQARLLEWVAISCSKGSSWPRDWTHISCIGRWILYHWALAFMEERKRCLLVAKSNAREQWLPPAAKRGTVSAKMTLNIIENISTCQMFLSTKQKIRPMNFQLVK